jgi:hypothetical protein
MQMRASASAVYFEPALVQPDAMLQKESKRPDCLVRAPSQPEQLHYIKRCN